MTDNPKPEIHLRGADWVLVEKPDPRPSPPPRQPMLTPKRKRLNAMTRALSEAMSRSCNLEMAADMFDRELAKSGYRVVKIRDSQKERAVASALRAQAG